MAFYLFFAIALIGIIITAVHYYLEKKDTGQTTVSRQTFFLLARFCSAVLYLPWIIYSWDPGRGSFGKAILSIPLMLLHIMKTVSGGANYDNVIGLAGLAEKSGASAGFLMFYSGFLYWIMVSVPFFGVWAVLGLFFNRIRFWFDTSRYSSKRTVYIFNGAGSRSIGLAQSIRESGEDDGPKCAFLFCNVNSGPDEETRKAIKKIGGSFSGVSPASLIKLVRYFSSKGLSGLDELMGKKSVRYFLLEDEQKNFSDTVAILKAAENLDRDRAKRVRINVLLQSSELDNILDAQDKNGILVKVLDAGRICAQDLFSGRPLFSCLKGDDNAINLVIFGKGKTAEELLRCAVWMGQLGRASLGIRYIGVDAAKLQKNLQMTCPALFDPAAAGGEKYEIRFDRIEDEDYPVLEQADIDDANYVIFAGENDDVNIRMAMWFRTWFSRRTPVSRPQPFTAVYVQDARKAERAGRLRIQESREPYDLCVFGMENRLFSARNLLHNKLTERAFRVQLSYNLDDPDQEPTAEQIRSTWDQLNASVYNFRSSEASALYIVNRLYDAGVIDEPLQEEIDRKRIDALTESYEIVLRDREVLEKLSVTEHRRWVAYMAVNGWVAMTEEEMKEWMKVRGSREHKDYMRLRHACMVPWDALDEVDVLKGKEVGFYKEADRKIVKGVRNFLA